MVAVLLMFVVYISLGDYVQAEIHQDKDTFLSADEVVIDMNVLHNQPRVSYHSTGSIHFMNELMP